MMGSALPSLPSPRGKITPNVRLENGDDSILSRISLKRPRSSDISNLIVNKLSRKKLKAADGHVISPLAANAPTTATTQFQYHSLPNSSTHIRLLKFATDSTSSDDIFCEISIHELAAAPAYHAISYTWGDAYPESMVNVDALPLTVRRNCWYALQQVRCHSETLELSYIWIDSICIHQSDVEEKSAQVQMMGAIFARAERVLACLGAEADDSDYLIAHLETLEPVLRERLEKPAGKPPLSWKAWLLSRLDQKEFEKIEQACLLLERRAFWTRVWILPEIFAAQKLSFLCGSRIFDWRLLDRFLFCSGFGKTQEPFGKRSDAAMLKALDWKRKMSKRIESSKFVDLIEEFSDWLCSDPRDRIYAFLHLVEWPQNVRSIKPDYNRSCLEVAIDLGFLFCQTRNVSPAALWKYAQVTFSMLGLTGNMQQHPFHRSELGSMMSLRCSPTSPELGTASDRRRAVIRYGMRGISDYRHLRARVPEYSKDLIPINDKNSISYLSSQSSWAFEAFETAAECHKPNEPMLEPIFISGERLYASSAVCGWICPGAASGDYLLDLGIDGLCLVLRRTNSYVVERTHDIVGQATVNPLFLSKARRVGKNAHDRRDLKN